MSSSLCEPLLPTAAALSLEARLDRLQAALVRQLAARGDEPATCRLLRLVPRPFSTIAYFHAAARRWQGRFVAKLITRHPANQRILEARNQAVVEHDVLARLHSAFESVEGCGVPRPVAVVPEVEGYVMEHVDGTLLVDRSRYLRRFSSRRQFGRLCHEYYLLGYWLRHFQQITRPHFSPAKDLSPLAQRCGDLFDQISAADPRTDWRPLRSRVLDDLEYYVRALKPYSVPRCGRHGDFGPWNVLAGRGGIAVIDFLGYEEGPLPLDLLKVLTYLDDELQCSTTSPRRVAALRAQFLEGYGLPPRMPKPLLAVCEILHRVSSLANCVLHRAPGWRRRRERRRVFKKQYAWLTAKNDRETLWPW